MAKSDVLVRMKADTQNYDANIAKARRTLDQFKRDNLSMGGVLKQLTSSLTATAVKFASVGAAIGAVTAAFRDNIATARNFEKSMSQLSSLTGMVGEDLNRLKEYAIELGSSTTLSASQVADAFRLIGSQQPQLLASGEALKAVTKNAITLAEAAGIELTEAASTLSVSINQMGGNSENAERYINVLAAAAQKGAGDIVWLGEAITKSGTTAKAVGTDYEELVANLEQLAKAGYDASTAGTALRSIIMNLEKQANTQYKPSVVGLTTAFKNLGEANLSLTEYQQLTGKMFAAQAKALADAAGEAANMTTQITGTNTAEEQAKTNTDNLDGSMKMLSSAWEGLNLQINSSNGLLRDCIDWLTGAVTWVGKFLTKLDTLWNKYGWMLSPSKEGAREGFANAFAEKYGNNADTTTTPTVPAPAATPAPTPAPGSGGGGGGGKKATQKILTEEQQNTAAIQKLAAEYEKASAERRRAIQEEIKVLQKRNQEIQHYKDLATGKAWEYQTTSPQDAITGGVATAPTDIKKGIAGGLKPEDMPKILSPLQQINMEIEHTRELMEMAPTKDAYTQMAEHLKDLQQQQRDFTNGGKNAENSWKAAAQAVGQVGQAMAGIENPVAKVMGTIAQAIAQIVLGYGTATAQAAEYGPWVWAGFAAGATAQMIAMISSIHSATGYANGGIVDGNSYTGDNVGPVMLDAGELILNRSQQGAIAAQLQTADAGGGYRPSFITGEQIFIAANRYAKRSGRGEIVTWKD